jgi:hypothetical protein
MTARTRLERLERQIGETAASGKPIVVRCMNRTPDAAIEAALERAGVDPATNRRQVIVLNTFYQERDGSLPVATTPPEVLFA